MIMFPSLLDDRLEVSQGSDLVGRILVVVTDFLQNRNDNEMFGHPARDTFDLVTDLSVSVQRLVLRSVWTVLQGCQKHENSSENHAPRPQED